MALPIAPVAALDTAAPNISTGDAVAVAPNAVENTGGNVEFGEGKVESKVVVGDPAAKPAVAPPVVPAAPVIKKNPAADAVARARGQVEAAKARAQAQIDAARARAEQSVAEAHQQAADAQARAAAQSDAARANAASAQADAANR